jgi:carnitine 3-dehydrogenase
MKSIKSAGVIGAGVIGSGWIARFLLNGIDVYVYDPSTEAPTNVDKVVKNAERSYKKLLRSDLPKKGTLSFSSSVSEVARSAKLIIEAVPERLSAKQSVYDEINQAAIVKSLLPHQPLEFCLQIYKLRCHILIDS